MQDLDGRFDWTSGLTTLQDAIDCHPLIVPPDAAVAQVAEQMRQCSSCALIQAGQQLLGIVTERDIVRLTAKGLDLHETPVTEVMARSLITLQWSELQNPFSALTLFQRHQIRHLPILNQQGELIGLLTPQILRQTMQSSDLLQLRLIADVMTTKVITAPPLTKVIALAQLMVNHRVSCVVIVESQGSTHPSEQLSEHSSKQPLQAASDPVPLGIVTEQDIVKFQSQQFDLYTLTAQQVMSTPLNCVSPDDTLWAGHQAMNDSQVRRLVVTHGERLAGIITQTSILSALNPVELYDTVQVLQTELARLQDERLLYSENQSLALNEQVKEGERRFRAIFNNTFQFTGLMKLDGTLIEANQTALAFGGLQREDVIGLPVWETYWWTISPETQAQLREATERAAQGEFIRYEVDVLGVGSQVITIDFSLRPLRDEQGNVVLLIPEGRDISDRKRAEEALKFQIEFDRLVATIANRFISLPSEELEEGIRRSLQEIGEFAGVETSYVFRFSEDQSSLSMNHEWVAPGFPPQIEQVQDIPAAAFPWGCEKLSRGEVLHLPDLDQLPPEAAVDQQSFQRFKLKAILSIPLTYQDEVLGWVGFASFTREQHWSEDSIRLLSIFAATLTQVLQRQRSEQALRQSEQRFESLAEIAPVGISKSDADGNCLYFNERWTVITGLSCDECQGDGWLQGVHPEDRDSVATVWHQSLQEHRPFHMEYRYLRPDGSIAWVIEQCVVEHDAQGQVTGYVGTLTDITERVQARQELEDSEERLRLALASGQQGFYDFNLKTDEIIVNDDYACLLGYDPRIFNETSSTWLERLHPEDKARIMPIFENLVRGEISEYSNELRQRTSNGDWKWLLDQGKVISCDEAGNPVRIIGTITDIDALKQAEQLKSELRVLEDILEATLAGYWDWDLPNNREYLSPTFKRMLGYEDHELVNEPESWQRLILAEDLPGVEAKLEQHIQSRGEAPFYNEVRYRHKNGSLIWVICAGRVIDWDETGQPLRLVGCHVDITRRKQAEEALRSLNQELQRSNKDLEQFAYITSHDLQEPLRAVTAYTNLLLEDYGEALTDANAQKYTGYILDGTQRMRELIRDLLTYSRVGSNELKLTTVDCNELLVEIQLNLQEVIAQSQAQITVEPLPVIEGDRTQLRQLFQNLLSNAIKFHQGNPPQVKVSAVQQSNLQTQQQPANIALRQRPHWLFSVQDQGIGIRPKYLERIFEIFQRLHTREQFPGTGMGLSICKRVMERHGGDIWVESQFREGSTFYCTFPTHQPTGHSMSKKRYRR